MTEIEQKLGPYKELVEYVESGEVDIEKAFNIFCGSALYYNLLPLSTLISFGLFVATSSLNSTIPFVFVGLAIVFFLLYIGTGFYISTLRLKYNERINAVASKLGGGIGAFKMPLWPDFYVARSTKPVIKLAKVILYIAWPLLIAYGAAYYWKIELLSNKLMLYIPGALIILLYGLFFVWQVIAGIKNRTNKY